MKEKTILLVEDNPDDAALTLRAFQKNGILNPVTLARDGREALDYLFGIGAHEGRDTSQQPVVTLLDLKLPRIDGLEVLQQIRQNEATRLLPVVILTSSSEDRTRSTAIAWSQQLHPQTWTSTSSSMPSASSGSTGSLNEPPRRTRSKGHRSDSKGKRARKIHPEQTTGVHHAIPTFRHENRHGHPPLHGPGLHPGVCGHGVFRERQHEASGLVEPVPRPAPFGPQHGHPYLFQPRPEAFSLPGHRRNPRRDYFEPLDVLHVPFA